MCRARIVRAPGPSNLWGFTEMEDPFTEGGAAVRPARVLFALALFLAACTSSVPSIGDKSAVSPAPGTPYTPPRGVVPAEPDSGKARATLPPDIAPHDSSLALSEVVDVALRNNPQTALS